MGRIRTVKPELFKHLALFEAEEKYQLPLRIAFAGLFTCCDREGRFLWEPRRLKIEILPYDSVDIIAVLNAFVETGFVKAYAVDGVVYGCIPTWESHQYFNNKEAQSKLPDIKRGKILSGPVQPSALAAHAQLSENNFIRAKNEDAVLPLEEPLEIPENSPLTDDTHASVTRDTPAPHASPTKEGKGKERKGKEERNIFAHWQRVMKRPNAFLDKTRQRCIQTALAMGYGETALCQAIDGCAQTAHNMGHNERGERYDGLHVILKSADQIDRFIRNAESPPRPGKAEQRLQTNLHAADQWLRQQTQPDQPTTPEA